MREENLQAKCSVLLVESVVGKKNYKHDHKISAATLLGQVSHSSPTRTKFFWVIKKMITNTCSNFEHT